MIIALRSSGIWLQATAGTLSAACLSVNAEMFNRSSNVDLNISLNWQTTKGPPTPVSLSILQFGQYWTIGLVLAVKDAVIIQPYAAAR